LSLYFSLIGPAAISPITDGAAKYRSL
jgi:hypothetical protein